MRSKKFQIIMSDDLLGGVEQFAEMHSISRSGAISVLVSQALQVRDMQGLMTQFTQVFTELDALQKKGAVIGLPVEPINVTELTELTDTQKSKQG